jgi:gluconate 2-dehydrogenase gamma chain
VSKRRVSRRDVLKSLTMGMVTGSVLRVIPAEAAEYARAIIRADTAKTGGTYKPKYFSDHQYKTLQALCQLIIPSDDSSGGAVEAGAPEFIDLLTSENPEYQLTLSGGMMWLDAACIDRFGKVYLDCAPAQQSSMLDSIAYRKNAISDPSLSQGVAFFSFLRNLTADGYFTSEIGIKYLGYIGNTYFKEFPGCPPVPES